VVSQFIFSLGGSVFPGGNGSMMIEAVPFVHILVNTIEAEVGDDVSLYLLRWGKDWRI
jgi:SulP family sulfate permease